MVNELIFDDEDEEKYLSSFNTRRILVAKLYDISEEIHHVHFTNQEGSFDEALLDSGCQKSCSGRMAYDNYIKTLSPEDKANIREYEGSAKFKFGGHGIYKSLKEVLVPIYVAGVRMRLRLDIVETDIPILLGLPVLKKLDLTVKYSRSGSDYGFFHEAKFRILNRQGHQYIRLSQRGSLDSLEPVQEVDPNLRVFISKVKAFDEGKVKSQLKQLHTNYAHFSKAKLVEVLKGSGQYEDSMNEILDQIYSECPVKRCRERVHTQLNHKAAFRSAQRLGDYVTTDLKIRQSGRHVMYLIDYATSYAVAGIISGKSSEEAAGVVVKKWYGGGMPRIRLLHSDNGKEFVGQEFKSVMDKFSTMRTFTAPYHAEMNGFCEKVHALIDLNMQKLMEEDSSLSDEDALIWALQAYNATPTFTGMAPAQMVYGLHNVLTPGQDLTPVQCQDSDTTSRYMKDLLTRQEAIDNHNMIRNSRKLRDVILGRSRPTPEAKKVGSYVWFKRHGQWRGPAQVGMSLAGECSVKAGNQWFDCKHNELLPLTGSELQAHNLVAIQEEAEEDDDSDDSLSSRGSSANTSDPDDEGVVEIEYSMENFLDRIIPQQSAISSPPTQSSQSTSQADSGQASNSQVSQDDDTQVAGGTNNEVPEQGADNGGARAEDIISEDNTRPREATISSSPRDGERHSVSNSQEETSASNGLSFDPLLFNRPTVDTGVERFMPKQKVRIKNPVTDTIEDVQIMNGFKRPSQKSWYRVKNSSGKSQVFDFNEIVWDYEYNTNLLSKRARIEPGKVYKVHHTIIEHSQHHLPGVVAAKKSELENHKKFGTFELIKESSLNEQQKQLVIPSTWAIVYKGAPGLGKIKARLCARGDKEPNVDMIRTDAPTASKDSIRILLSISASTGWKLHSLDFQAAFIQGKDIDRELYMKPPPDYRKTNPGIIFRIRKRLYGLRDASRGWVTEIRDYLLGCGMIQSSMDRALFFMKDSKGELIGLIVTHIDDFLFIGSEAFHKNVIHKVLKKYVVGTLEDTSLTFTGWELRQDVSGIQLTQKSYHDQMDLRPYAHMKLYTAKDTAELGEQQQVEYRQLVGVLNWLVTSSKPALAHFCNHAAAKLGKATKAEAKALIRVLEKAKSEPEVIKFSNLGSVKNWSLEVYADAALGRSEDVNTYIGDIAFIQGEKNLLNVINWSATKLNIPTASILNAEAEAVTNAHGKIKYLRYIFEELFSRQLPATIHTDSKSLYQTVISDNSIRNRRISAAVATIRCVKTQENISLHWVKGLGNLSDPLTKLNANSANLKHVLASGKLMQIVE